MARNDHSLDQDDEELWTFSDGESVPQSQELHRALMDQERRRAMYCLLEYDEQSIDEMTDILVGWDLFEDHVIDKEEWERTRSQLVHVHLPMLEDCDLIQYDTERGDIQIENLADPVRDLVWFSQKYDQSLMADKLR